MSINLFPTFSRYANPTAIPPEMAAHSPPGFRLMKHQVETYQAVRDHRADVIIHTGFTGDGKSLAGMLPTLLHKNHYLWALYPTNELIADQKRQLEEARQAWGSSREILMLTAETLDAHMDKEGVDRAGALLSLLGQADVVLTNPDIFHYIVSGGYVKFGQQPFRVLERVMQLSEIVVDEFHLYDQAQTTALLTAMIFLKQVLGKQSPVFVLQSATPDLTVSEALTRGGLSVETVAGEYQHRPQADDQYRRILHGVTLEIVSSSEGGIRDWLEQQANAVLLPALRDGQGRGAVLFTSVFETLQAYPVAQQALPGLTVAHNTGLTPPSMKRASRHADVLLGTATVDTGVDLAINRLVFEAYDAANFRQRFGRLGRHDGYIDAKNEQRLFKDFAAVACVPPWVKAYFDEHATPNMARDDFFGLVDAAYGAKRGHIYAYNRTWGWLPAYDLTNRMGNPIIRGNFADVQESTSQALSDALGVKLNKKRDQFLLLRTKAKTPATNPLEQQARADKLLIGKSAFTFRNSNALTALIVNNQYTGTERYQYYDFLSLVTRLDFKVLDYHLTHKQAKLSGVPDLTLQREDPVIALEWQGAAAERRSIALNIDRGAWKTIAAQVAQGVFVTDGLRVQIDPVLSLGDDVVSRIAQKRLVMRIVMNYAPSELRRRLHLSLFFPLYRFETYDGQSGSIALGRDALMLDAAVMHLRETEPGAFIVG